ncbi:MAG: hypothetical protein FJ299_00560 [Planctomycetes bacterium]|nr:hypothetical protein [Planctomycetota bacterium]
MSAIEIFRLQPGEQLELRVSSASRASGWRLLVKRPYEGASPNIELQLRDAGGSDRGRSRLALEDGYLAIARELRGWLRAAGIEAEFDLVPLHGQGQALSESSSTP